MKRTLFFIGFVFAAILFIVCVGLMLDVVFSGGKEMLHSIHAAIPLFAGFHCNDEELHCREVNLRAKTIRDADSTRLTYRTHFGDVLFLDQRRSNLNLGSVYKCTVYMNGHGTITQIQVMDKLDV